MLIGNPGTQTDEADVLLALSLTDVRCAGDLSDYTGELSAPGSRCAAPTRRTSPFGTTPATMVDRTFSFDATCTATGGRGGRHLLGADQRRRAPTRHRAGGPARDLGAGTGPASSTAVPDGDTATEDNTLFEVGGVFIP